MAALLGWAVSAVPSPQVLGPQAAASGLGAVTLRFDGSLRGRSGGAGAVLLHEGAVVWQAARYLERPATSAHAEYEGLLLGLRGARALRARQVTAEGDCRLVLRQMEGGVPAAELCREHGMSSATLYKWRAKYGGMDASLINEMKAMAEENRRLKRMYADVSMQNDLLKEALGKK